MFLYTGEICISVILQLKVLLQPWQRNFYLSTAMVR